MPMQDRLPLLVFSDLDGTLLDHDTYKWDAAVPALRQLRQIGAGVVLASSKTAAEMRVIRSEMGLSNWPAIVENGAGVLGEGGSAADYQIIRDALDDAPYRTHFRGFGDMSVQAVVDATGLSHDAAELAKTRQFSEPGIWSGTDAEKARFLAGLADAGISAREGGRFLTLSMGKTKADQMAQLFADLKPEHTLALGDAPNDVEMLEAADHGVIIANPHRPALPPLAGEQSGTITRSREPGPIGWNAAVIAHLNTLNFKQTDTTHG